MPAWRTCDCPGTQGRGGHRRFDCSGCSYTRVPGCEDPLRRATGIDYTRPRAAERGLTSAQADERIRKRYGDALEQLGDL